ncbi:MAG: DUF5916 domain-containing protein [Pseudomonadota bacterium]
MRLATNGARLAALAGALLTASAMATTCPAPSGNSAAAAYPEIPRLTGEPTLDGRIDEEFWASATKRTLTYETRPAENAPPPVETEVYLAENGTTLFAAFRAHDPNPDRIRAFLRDRDSAYGDDFVGIVVDTFNDERFAFEFFVNPLGVQMDLTQDDVNGNEDDSWDAIWDSAGSIGEQGYEVEVAIPLQQLRFPQSDTQQVWGIDLLRFYPRSVRHRISNVPLDRARDCYLCQLQKFRGFGCASPGRNLVITPQVTTTQTDLRDDVTEPLISGDAEVEPGIDVRWGVTPQITLSATVNPDFSQVEADTAQLAVNQQFELFFPEQRPFFLEGADYFQTPIDAVFTRTVADPDVGAKLVGKAGRNLFGVFAAQDAKTNFLFPSSLGSDTDTLDESSDVLVSRYRVDLPRQSTFGALLTARRGEDYHNIVAGLDGRYRFTSADSLTFQWLLSDTEYPEAIALDNDQPQALDDDAYFIRYVHNSRNWRAVASHDNFGRDFRADLGFVTRVDSRRSVVGLFRTWFPQGFFNEIEFGGDWDITHDQDGRLLEREIEASAEFEGPLQSYVEFGAGNRDRRDDDTLFEETFGFIYGEFQPFSGAEFSVLFRLGDQIDFANTQLGEQFFVRPAVEWNMGRHLALRARHTFQQLDRDSDGARIFTANLTDLRLTWQFSIRSFARLVVQHQDIDRNVAAYVDADTEARSRSLATQFLYSYMVNPQTVLFAGYSDAAEDGVTVDQFTKTNRTFFVKVSYAWLP